MKKQVIILVVCIVFAAVLGGALYFLMQYEPEGEQDSSSESTAVALVEKTEYDVDTVTIENGEGSFTIKNLGDSQYEIPEVKEAPLNTLAGTALKRMALLSATSTVSESPEDLGTYGLQSPSATVSAKYTDGSSFTLLLGDDAPGNNGTYGKTPDKDTVYLFSTSEVQNFKKSVFEFVDKTVTNQPDENYQQTGNIVYPDKVTLGGSFRSEPIVMQIVDAEEGAESELSNYGLTMYTMTSPKVRPVDSDKGTDALTNLMTITADAVVAYEPTPEQMKEYGLDEPYSTAEFTYKDLEESEHKVNLRLSAPDAEGNAYLLKEGTPLVYKIAVAGLPWYEMSYGDFISTLLFTPFIDDIKTLTVSTPTSSYVYEMSGEGDELKVTCNGQEVDTKKFRSLYQTLIGIPAEEYTEEKPAKDAAILLAIEYAYRDVSREHNTVQLIAGPTRKAFLFNDGDGEFFTKAGYADTILQNCQNLLEGKDIKPLY